MSKSTSRSKKQRSGGSVDPAPLSEARSLWPPRRLIVSLCSLAAAAAMVRAGLLESVVGGVVDGAVRNIITLILCFSALMSAVLWFVRESGHSSAWKRGLAFGLLGLVALGLATLRIERVSGDLVPEFRWAGQKSRDTLLARPAATPPQVSATAPWQPAPHDFFRFLGPAGAVVSLGGGLSPADVALWVVLAVSSPHPVAPGSPVDVLPSALEGVGVEHFERLNAEARNEEVGNGEPKMYVQLFGLV
jgi:hypothetical protein